jgi:hypothetical protein
MNGTRRLSKENKMLSQTALKYDLEVKEDGQVQFQVPFPSGSHLVVFVMEVPLDDTDDLMIAAQSSLDFWDNPIDDEEWNHA